MCPQGVGFSENQPNGSLPVKTPSYTPLFILGQPRSGTTALAKLLNVSPLVACLHYEGNILYRLWQTLQRRAVLEEPVADLLADFEVTARHNLVERTPQTPAGKINFSEENIRLLLDGFRQGLETCRDPVEIYRRVSIAFFEIFSENSKARIVGDKVPDFIHIPAQITAPHPNSLVISISRDPRAVVHSSLKFRQPLLHLFAVDSAFAMAATYCLKQEGLQQFQAGFPPQRFLSLPHEDILADPQNVLEKSCRFFNLPDPVGLPEGKEPFPVKQWEKEMRQEDVDAVNAVCSVFDLLDTEEQPPPLWREKAAAVKPLSSCADKDIGERTRMAAGVFATESEKKELGLTLGQFADYAHRGGRFSRAEAFFSQAVSLAPHDPILWYKYATLCFDMKLLDQARQFADHCEKHCPRTEYYTFLRAKNQYLAGMICRLQGNAGKAGACFETALRIKGDFSLPRRMLKILHPDKD